jgi:hypothetical protein
VAFSLGKRVRRPEVVEEDAFMHRQHAWRAALEWVAFTGVPPFRPAIPSPVRYEDLSDPRRVSPFASRSTHGPRFCQDRRIRVTLAVTTPSPATPCGSLRALELHLTMDGGGRCVRWIDAHHRLTAPAKRHGYG